MRIREGLVVAGRGITADAQWVRIFHMCDGVAWVRADQIAAIAPAPDVVVGNGFDFADAVIVVDDCYATPVDAVGPLVEGDPAFPERTNVEFLTVVAGDRLVPLEAMTAAIPAGVMGSPEDFGRVAAFLCSEPARFVTGAALPIDGGGLLNSGTLGSRKEVKEMHDL